MLIGLSLILFVLITNITTFLIWMIDAFQARKKEWKRSPFRLGHKFLIASTLPCPWGAILGQWIFQHKIKNVFYLFFVPIVLIVHVVTFISTILILNHWGLLFQALHIIFISSFFPIPI